MKKITIKEIAKMAQVSIGTVDRVLHNRGEVAEKTKALVLKIAKERNYATNVYARNLKLNRTYNLGIIIPHDNEYWNTLQTGMKEAAKNHESLGLNLHFYTFDRTNRDSFMAQSEEAIRSNPDGVVLAPLMMDESVQICLQLENHKIPYVFVDSNLKSASPLAFIGQDTAQSGCLAAKLLNFGFKKGHQTVVVKYTDFDRLNKTIEERVEGYRKFYDDNGWDQGLISELEVPKGFNLGKLNVIPNSDFHVFVPNSRAHQIVQRMNEEGLTGVNRVVGYDKIAQNIAGLKTGQIDFIINQNPFQQGYLSVQAFYKHLILNSKVDKIQYMPIEIVTKENLTYSDITG